MTAFRINSPATTGYGSVSIATPNNSRLPARGLNAGGPRPKRAPYHWTTAPLSLGGTRPTAPSLASVAVADSGGGARGPGPPLRESKKGPHERKIVFVGHGKEKFCATTPPPTESRRLSETTEKFCYYPPPTESHRLLEIAEKFCYYPPPLNRVDMALHTKGGPLFRKILDLRLSRAHVLCRRQLGICERSSTQQSHGWSPRAK